MRDEETTDRLAKIIWNYHQMHQPLTKADALFVLCSHDTRVAEYAADLFLQNYAPFMIFSGGVAHGDDLLHTGWDRSEAEMLAEVAVSKGVPTEKILLETKATNTGENIAFARQLLEEKQLHPASFILVQKPYMERRTYATFARQWPDKTFVVTSPPISYHDYVNGDIPKDAIISIMVGDLQRIKEYPALGFQIPQEIPSHVWAAFEQLVALGFTKHLLKSM